LLVDSGAKLRAKNPKSYTHTFKVKAPLLGKHEVVCLIGSGVALGEWQSKQPVLFSKEGNWWVANVQIPREDLPLEYKYGVYQVKEKKVLEIESGPNRYLPGEGGADQRTLLHDGFIQLSTHTWRGAGIAIPVFSLRSKDSFGVGEFTDIQLLVDWAKSVELKLIQLLPINDTHATGSWTDSYPYAAISAFALHPQYINLEAVAGKKHAALLKPFKKKQKQLNELAEIDYEQVMKFKLEILRELFEVQQVSFLQEEDFVAFFDSNRHWLVPYAAFCYLKDKNGTADFSQWKIYSTYQADAIDKYVSPRAKHFKEISFQYFVQYHLHLQLKAATEYAHKHGVVVKGDIPIGIYRHSCDAWVAPHLYHMDEQAGAPPDDFAVKGQNWGFPTYNWQRMADDGFAWWKQRFEQMSYYFDAFRIDHILGFFRIWSIPLHAVEGILGRFVPSLPLRVNEFTERSIYFDRDRYVKPYLTESIVYQLFGEKTGWVKTQFLQADGYGQYQLHPDFNTQRKLEAYFQASPLSADDAWIQQKLYDAISNVILLEEPVADGVGFHFRIGMEQTLSFQQLDGYTQQQLRDLYVHYFYQRQDDFWRKQAMQKLPALKASTTMLVCGEDLGMVPHCVPDVMQQLGLLSLEIQRMPKDATREFFHPNDAPYLSVVTPSTHDMSTIRGWWEEDRVKTQRFFNHELGQWGDAPLFCEPWINKAIVLQHLHSPAMWSVFQWQDLMGMDGELRREDPSTERINQPANPKHYWRYRMHITLESLLKAADFNASLKEYIVNSGRA
jgi:4-alpha-glucanotransferase